MSELPEVESLTAVLRGHATGHAVARADAALADLLRRERALLSVLDRSERQRLADLMRTLLVPFDALLSRSPPAYSNSAAMVSQRSSRSDFSVWTARSSAPREVSFS